MFANDMVVSNKILFFFGLLMFGLVVGQFKGGNEVDPADRLDDVMMMDEPRAVECKGNDNCTEFMCDDCALFYFDHNGKITIYSGGDCTPCPTGYWCKYHSYDLGLCVLRAKCAPPVVLPENATAEDRYKHTNAYLIPRAKLDEYAQNGQIFHCKHYRKRED